MKKKSNYSRFLLLWAGSMISQVGGGLTSFGLGVYIFNRTGSAAQMALVTLLGFLPTLLLSVPAGVLADLFDRRLLMMIGDGCSAIGILYILLCMNSLFGFLSHGSFILRSLFSILLNLLFLNFLLNLLFFGRYFRFCFRFYFFNFFLHNFRLFVIIKTKLFITIQIS